jgi:DNA polymerase-3 subunit beta
MKIRILQENLIKSVQDSMKFISNKPQIPILSCILLEAKEGKLHLKATDLAVSIHSTVGCKVEQEGEAAVSGRVFADLLSTLPAGPVDMFVDGGKLMIRAAKVKSSVALSESKEFPPFPEEKGKKISLSKKKLSSLLELGGIAAGVDETRPMFSCLRFECAEDELAVVATDGYRLSRKHEKISAGATEGVMVSARMMREAERILERLPGDNVEMSISEEVGQVFFRTEDCSISLRMISGDYPNYQAIVPAECGVVVEMNVEELLAAIKTAMVFSRSRLGVEAQ